MDIVQHSLDRDRDHHRVLYGGRDMKEGDTIKCHDADDMIRAMTELAREGIETDFVYEKDGKKGFWLEVTDIKERRNK